MKKNKILVSVLAYNAEGNIRKLTKSLAEQKFSKDVFVDILIHSDQSSDNTVKEAKKIKCKRVNVISSSKRLGFAGSVENVLKKARGYDAAILFNDDIFITDKNLITKLVKPLLIENNVGLICGNPQPIKSENFIQKAIESSFRAYEKMAITYKNGNSQFSCDGKILVLSKNFIKSLNFPKNKKRMGNVDTYLYLSCIKNGFLYRYINSAKVFYKNPSSLSDYLSWFIRNNSNRHVLKEEFGELVDREYKAPRSLTYYKIVEFLKNPIGALFVFSTGFYIKLKAKSLAKNFSASWDRIKSVTLVNSY